MPPVTYAIARRLRTAGLFAALVVAAPVVAAEPPAFDLPGPRLAVTVKRGETTLPIGQVPTLAAGDVLTIRADLPEDQRAHYLLVSAFLSGATNPPPKDWLEKAETWKDRDKDSTLTLTVPKGARQLILFLVPETGGARGSIVDAVRGRPGEFVRATQDLNQASLDRSRLNSFMSAIRAQENTHPEYLRTVAPTLAQSLSIKLKEDCLSKVIEMQAACLLENRDTLVLADIHSNSMTDTLVGAPTDLALQVSYTREAGLGYYSPYIGVVRDIARVFGAFNNPQFRYLPTLSTREGKTVSILLNTAPSFSKPKSVLVVAMPGIDGNTAPRLRNTAARALCGSRPDLVLPVEGAPLIYSTGYAHDMALRLTEAGGGTLDVPVTARADRGGYVLDRPLPRDLGGKVSGRLVGRWGFDAMNGPDFAFRFAGGAAWKSESRQLVIGRDDETRLNGGASACVSGVVLRGPDGTSHPLKWKPVDADSIAVTLPLKQARPGAVTVEVREYGAASPTTLTFKALTKASEIDAVAWHSGDRSVTLTGQRLDAVAGLDFGGVSFVPGKLQREGDVDRIDMLAPQSVADPGTSPVANVTLKDGRTLRQGVTVLPARPAGVLLARTLMPPAGQTGLPLVPEKDDVLPDSSRLVFSVKAQGDSHFTPDDAIEVATLDEQHRVTLSAGSDTRLAADDTLVATLDPARLGAAAVGPLRYRIVHGKVAGDWQMLTRLVRMPRIDSVDCGARGCELRGRDLFLIDAIAATPTFAQATAVPVGYTGASLPVPTPSEGKLQVRLRDAGETSFRLSTR